ncbi:hypothetical protein [Roseovarius indicus]|uniref:hypothetical protein n=1 Tax=Roseovarius indicus TaxID=540747 RepID=UPI0032EC7C91
MKFEIGGLFPGPISAARIGDFQAIVRHLTSFAQAGSRLNPLFWGSIGRKPPMIGLERSQCLQPFEEKRTRPACFLNQLKKRNIFREISNQPPRTAPETPEQPCLARSEATLSSNTGAVFQPTAQNLIASQTKNAPPCPAARSVSAKAGDQ